MSTFQFNLVSPDSVFFDQSVEMVVIPGIQGDIGVLAGHAPLVTLLRPGIVTIYGNPKSPLKIFVEGGVAEMTGERCSALITAGVPVDTLDKGALEIEIKGLLGEVEKSITAEDRAKADKSLAIAQAKLMEVLSSIR